jgi:hypothetical protein
VKTVTPGFDFLWWGLEVVQTNAGTATKTKNRLACYLWSKGYNVGVNNKEMKDIISKR